MLLTITTTHSPATDLGYLLGKHPDQFQTFDLTFGKAQVFYPEATAECCTAALLLEVDPVKLVRGTGTSLDQYVNDRPYLKRQKSLAQTALVKLGAEESLELAAEEVAIEKPISLNSVRQETVIATLKKHQAKSSIDLGCGEGKLISRLAKDNFFEKIAGMDVSYRSIEYARQKLERLFLSAAQLERVEVFQGSLAYRDRRLENYDAATLIEVIEHLDKSRLAALERVVFEFAHPRIVLITTPNSEYNIKFENLPTGKFRHHDHRFEWTREEFQIWAIGIAERFNYTVSFDDIGSIDPIVGAPTQMAIFESVN